MEKYADDLEAYIVYFGNCKQLIIRQWLELYMLWNTSPVLSRKCYHDVRHIGHQSTYIQDHVLSKKLYGHRPR